MGIFHRTRGSVENVGVGRIECQENVIFNDFSRLKIGGCTYWWASIIETKSGRRPKGKRKGRWKKRWMCPAAQGGFHIWRRQGPSLKLKFRLRYFTLCLCSSAVPALPKGPYGWCGHNINRKWILLTSILDYKPGEGRDGTEAPTAKKFAFSSNSHFALSEEVLPVVQIGSYTFLNPD